MNVINNNSLLSVCKEAYYPVSNEWVNVGGGGVAERLECWTCNPKDPSSSPTLTASWICFTENLSFKSSATLVNRYLRSESTTAVQLEGRPMREHHLLVGIIMRIEMHQSQRTNMHK